MLHIPLNADILYVFLSAAVSQLPYMDDISNFFPESLQDARVYLYMIRCGIWCYFYPSPRAFQHSV
jgi:hypothetical protein